MLFCSWNWVNDVSHDTAVLYAGVYNFNKLFLDILTTDPPPHHVKKMPKWREKKTTVIS